MDASLLAKLYTEYLASTGVSIDTRRLEPGQLFFALKGPNFDGNRYAVAALAAGASLAIVDDPNLQSADGCLWVPNVLAALQELAHYRRMHHFAAIPVIAITGSNGKTTTKELLQIILGLRYLSFATPGNLNNQIGLPLTLLRAPADTEVLILEMGDNHRGDITELCQIAEPTVGLITNIGMDHIGFFADMQDNADSKLELFDWHKNSKRLVFLNQADRYLSNYNHENLESISYNSPESILHIQPVENTLSGQNFTVFYTGWREAKHFSTPLYGAYNLENIAAALVVALHYGCTAEQLQQGLSLYSPTNNRSQIIRKNSKTLILDAYNANPSSMEAALSNLTTFTDSSIGIVLGDMLELGSESTKAHINLAHLLNKLQPKITLLIGREMAKTFEALKLPQAYWFADAEQAGRVAKQLMHECDLLLFKGSRGIAVEKVAETIF